jgi:hypothetical protein
MINNCAECLKKQQKIDELLEENTRLKQSLRYQQRSGKEGFFGSSTPSSKLPVKANRYPVTPKPRGARLGHRGTGRKAWNESEADSVVEIPPPVENHCPECGVALVPKGVDQRGVIESQPLKAKRLIYRLGRKYCPRCQKIFQAHAPGVLPKSLYGN